MSVHSPLAYLFPRASHSPSTRGHTLGAPAAYDAFVNFFFFGRRPATFASLIRAAGVHPDQRVLDVGCGTGYFAGLLAEAVGPAGLVLGIDASPEMIGYATRRRSRPNCQFQVGTAESLGLPADHFDVVVSSLFMHHLPADLQPVALVEMHRVLRPGGTLLIAEAQVPRARGWRLLARLHGFDRMAQAAADLERLIGDAKFEDVRTGEAPPWLRYVRAVKNSNVASAWNRAAPPTHNEQPGFVCVLDILDPGWHRTSRQTPGRLWPSPKPGHGAEPPSESRSIRQRNGDRRAATT